MHKFRIVFNDGSHVDCEINQLSASPWFMLWNNHGVDYAYQMIDKVQFIIYMGENQMNEPYPPKQFNQQEIINKVQSVKLDESDHTFGDIITKRFDSYTAEPDDDGRLIAVYVAGFCDGTPIFIGEIKYGVDVNQAIHHAEQRVAERCRDFMLQDALKHISGRN